jgi:hypothetical protein
MARSIKEAARMGRGGDWVHLAKSVLLFMVRCPWVGASSFGARHSASEVIRVTEEKRLPGPHTNGRRPRKVVLAARRNANGG